MCRQEKEKAPPTDDVRSEKITTSYGGARVFERCTGRHSAVSFTLPDTVFQTAKTDSSFVLQTAKAAVSFSKQHRQTAKLLSKQQRQTAILFSKQQRQTADLLSKQQTDSRIVL